MSWLYLVRHGQAGTRAHYDTLSELGRDQARRLGVHFAAQGLRPARVLAGSLVRQQQTAALAAASDWPAAEVDPGWTEFDLDAVYREIAPQLARVDAEFAHEYAHLERVIDDPENAIHRKWTAGDVKVVRAWISGQIPVTATETWEAFRARVQSAFERAIADHPRDEAVVVFTSATPIGLSVAHLLQLPEAQALRLAGAKLNSACTIFRVRPGETSLFAFNTAPHLPDPALHTFR